MSQIVQSDGVGVLFAPESTPGTQPTSGWLQLQPNPGGITQYDRQLVTVERHILSPNMTAENGEVVGYDVSPKYVQDLTTDLLDAVRELLFRSATKHSGGKGQSKYAVSAVTATGYTVASLGDLANGILVEASGFNTAANNGLKLLAGTSIATEIKTTGLTAEATPPANAIVRVAGVQGATSDITLDASGNLTSTILDFTTLGLNVGQDIVVGDLTSGAAFAFATAAYNGKATIVAITAHKITLKWRAWTVAGADLGTGQTIRLLFTSWIRNVPIAHADYLAAPTGNMEVSEPGAGTAGATDYIYVGGCGLSKWSLAIPLENKIVATLDFVGMNASEPGAARATGADAALAPLLTSVFTTSSNVRTVKLLKQADETVLADEINDIKLNYDNHLKPRKAIGTDGAKGLTYGEYAPTIDLDTYLIANDTTRAADTNTSCALHCLLKSADGGFSLGFPMGKLTKPAKTYAAATPVMQKFTFTANRDPATGLAWTMSQFAYLP